MNEISHALTATFAVQTARQIAGLAVSERGALELVRVCAQTDHFEDVEFVGVAGARDNPHARGPRQQPDQAHTVTDRKSHTAFNHFLDLKKGLGIFDDYDGYAYFRGSAHTEEFQKAQEITGGWGNLAARLTGFKVDEGLNYWFNNEYVHAPGQKWYRACSPALERYSFPEDLGIYPNRRAENLARFPLAAGMGGNDQGIPYSVFFPVDNLARYWYARFQANPKTVEHLGPVLHAVQDASIPHHAAGYNGNWHIEYENALDLEAPKFCRSPAFAAEIGRWLKKWQRHDPKPPVGALRRRDRLRSPAVNWSIPSLVTWMAWNAYYEYEYTYHHFKRGFKIVPASLKHLYTLAAGVSILVLVKALVIPRKHPAV